MAEDSKISWTHHTHNHWEGCTKVGPGCDHCYAEARNARFGGGTAPNWGPGAPRRLTSAKNRAQPLLWNAIARDKGMRQRVFCSSLADVFDNEVPPAWRLELWDLIDQCDHLDFLLLTKRIGNAKTMLPLRWLDKPKLNVWLGATIVNQEEADRDIPKLLATPARLRFLSMEPLLGPVDLGNLRAPDAGFFSALHATADTSAVDWVIVGGESGPGARPMDPAWAVSLRDQCIAAGVPFHFKQWGEWAPTVRPDTPDGWRLMQRMGKAAAGHLLQGEVLQAIPQVRA